MAMQIDETLIRSVVEQVLSRLGGDGSRRRRNGSGTRAASACSPTSTRPWPPPARPSSGSRGMTIDDRRRIIDHIRRISIEQSRRAGHDGDGRDEDRPAGAQDREAQDAGRAVAGRRVPPQRGLQRRSRPGGDRARPLRRHRRHHAGDPLAAHDHRQRRQHDRRRQHAGRQSASRAASASRPRASAASTRRSIATWASTT